MAKEKQTIVWQSPKGRIVVVDTISYLDEGNEGDIVVGGSHCAKLAAKYACDFKVRGVILNDAGKGKDNAGIVGLEVLEEHGVPGATVSCMSAYIGNGMSTYEDGEISVVNEQAMKSGISIGMSAKEAAKKMLEK